MPCQDSGLQDARDTVAIFSSTIAITLATVYSLARIGFDNPLLPVLKTLSLSLFVLLLPQGYRFISQRLPLSHHKFWFTTDAAILLLSLTLLTVSGILVPLLNLNLLPLFSSISLLLFSISYISFLNGDIIKQKLIFLTVTALFGLWVASAVWGSGYQNPLFEENLIANTVHIDTLFHSSISNAIRTYGIPSTGLDGVPYLFYHIGSHWIFAHISNLINTSAIKFYQLAYPIIFIPFLLQSILLFVIETKQYVAKHGNLSNWSLKLDWQFWLIFFVAFIGFMPAAFTEQSSIWRPGIFISESYGLAIAFSFILMSITLSGIAKLRKKNKFNGFDITLLFFIIPTLLAIVTFLKIAIGFILFNFICYLFWRLELYKHKAFIICMALTTITFLIAFKLTHPPSSNTATSIKLFAFVRDWVQDPWKPFFFIIYFFWPWAFIILKFIEKKVQTLADIRKNFQGKQILDIELTLLACLVGMVPGTVLAIPGAGAGYFSEFQMWVALSFLLANIDNFKFLVSYRAKYE